MGVILEPEVGEETLYYHHGDADKEGIGDAELRLEIEAIIGKQSATDDRLACILAYDSVPEHHSCLHEHSSYSCS